MPVTERTFRLYNTLTRTVDAVEPIEPGHLRFYSCGPTVYSYAHIGNFRTFLTADLILRTARAIGWKTTYVSNITDVGHLTEDDVADISGQDRMAKALHSKEGERFANVWDLSDHYARALIEDWKTLNMFEPDVRPRATQHIREQILAVEALIENGYAYETSNAVYFSVEQFPEYGKLSGNNNAEGLEQAVRDIVVDSEKRDPRDFALWKKDDKHLMQWYSPWGWGFPGWHIECSVMAHKYLGETFDIHAGGEDLTFPHHECEIAQAESLTGKPFANYWVHTRFLQVEGEKMSKRLGNYFTIHDLVKPKSEGGRGVNPLAVRYALISGHYRKPFNFTLKNLKDSVKIISRYQEADEKVKAALQNEEGTDYVSSRLDQIYDRTLEALLEDLNTPEALAQALSGVKLIHGLQNMNAASARSAQMWLDRINKLLGIVRLQSPSAAGSTSNGKAEPDPMEARIEAKIAERNEARKNKDWARSDAIRDELLEMGIEVKDTAQGTVWKRKLNL
jgi:cysteinyl-tRNA synthetase